MRGTTRTNAAETGTSRSFFRLADNEPAALVHDNRTRPDVGRSVEILADGGPSPLAPDHDPPESAHVRA
jgi:hypothetical protein